MPATVLTLDEIRAKILRDIRNIIPDANTGADSDYYARASGVASAIEGLYAHQAWAAKQIFPDTADADMLLLHARLRGIERKSATVASGTVRVSGKPGAHVASGLDAKYRDGTAYQTTSGGTLDVDGGLVVDIAAVAAGAAGNRQDSDTLTLTVPPADVDSTATVVTLRGGTEIESLDSVLDRLLKRIRRPAAGGNKYDYWQWAMEVPGVTSADIYPLRRGLGTVDVVITSDGALPSDEVVKAAQAHIDDQRPVRAKDARVIVPAVRAYDVSAELHLHGTTIEAARDAIIAALNAYDSTVSPGEQVIRNRIGAVINDTSGVVDYVLRVPAENVVPVENDRVIEWCRLGNVGIEEAKS